MPRYEVRVDGCRWSLELRTSYFDFYADLLQAALLGVVQGLTEFLPVSSSAHLILARAFFGFDGDKFGLAFDVACHIGTLIAVLIYFRSELARLVAALPRLFDLPGSRRRA